MASMQGAAVSIKRVTFSQPSAVVPGIDSRTRLSSSLQKGGSKLGGGRRVGGTVGNVDSKKRRHFLNVKSMSQPLLETGRQQQQSLASGSKKRKGKGGEAGKVDEMSTASTTTQDGSDSDKKETKEEEEDRHTCPDYFGVKSYLHHFYETVSVKNPDMYEELEGAIGAANSLRKPRCRSIWWKVAVGFGVSLLLLGIIVILIGYLMPRRQVVVGFQNELEVVDKSAVRYNYNLDTCRLIGLIVFCVGGTVVAIALLFPSFFYNYCEEEWSLNSEPLPFKVAADSGDGGGGGGRNELPRSPSEKKVPVTEQVTRIQPTWEKIFP